MLRRSTEARRLGAYLVATDPLNYWAHVHYSEALAAVGRHQEAIDEMTKAFALGPDNESTAWKLGLKQLFAGEPKAARESFLKEVEGSPYRLHGLALASHDLGDQAAFETQIARLAEIDPEWVFGQARAWAWVGDADKAFEYLDKSLAQGVNTLAGSIDSPFFDKIRDDSRWPELLQRAGMTHTQLAEIDYDYDSLPS